ncbi:MAG: hypothetical protein LBG59_09020 [Candidatus Peribacteria bacterium]|jgi:hypothetical protein|nr:hypothetical protein [Candidatus Peribacteria bacterium]
MAVQRIENLEQMGEVRAKLNDNFSYLDTKGYPKSEIDEKLATKASIQQLTEKVDKQPNKTLTSNDFTDELKQKLESMEDEHFRGEFVSYEALVEAIPTGNIGDYAYVDE